MKFKDLSGERFGRLQVLHRVDDYVTPKGKKVAVWLCKCDCGNVVTVRKNQLTGGQKSCGCLQREKAESAGEDLTGQRFGRLTVVKKVRLDKPTSNGVVNGWLCKCDCGNTKVLITKKLKNNLTKSCGCLIRDKAIDRLQNDNVVGRYKGTVITAISPARKLNKNNKSGTNGVYWNSSENKYIAKITLRNKSITIGRFDYIEDAIKARKLAEEEYYAPIIDEFLNLKNE